MKFEYISYLPLLVIFFTIYIILFYRVEKKNRKTIKLYWFYDFSSKLKVSNLFYIAGVGLLLVALMDLRGDPEKHSAKIPKQKTIILMDTSLSMNAEDVRPNRFKKSVLLARHMIKKLVGHSVSVIIFSDIHKRLVPFTSDLDLLDSRISGLNDLKIRRGGTNLSSVLMESLSYLKDDEGKPVGNVILLTDAEENEIPINLKIPDNVSVALLAVGTKQGGKIPIRGNTGMYIGSKRFGGKEVITRIDEATIKRFAKDIKFFKYWITNTYSLPTENVVTFLNRTHKSKFSTGEVISKPVLGYKIIVTAFVLIFLSSLGRFGKVLVKASMLIMLVNPAFSQQQQNSEKEKEKKELSELGKELLSKLKQASATETERLKLAEQYMLANHNELSDLLYEKNLKDKYLVARVNSALPKIATKNLSGALEKYHDVLSDLSKVQGSESVEKIKEVIRTNTLLALAQKKQQQKQNKKDQKDQKNKKGGGGGSSDKEKKKNDKEKEKKNQKNKNDQKKENKDKEKQKQQKQQRKKVQIPSLLKQLVNDDRKLQGKMLDTTTYKGMKRGERRSRVKKSW